MKPVRRTPLLGITLAVLGLSIILVSGVSYYIGIEIEKQLLPWLKQPQTIGKSQHIQIESIERGIFRTHATYLVRHEAEGGPSITLRMTDDIDHGPFPWNRLARLQLMPMAVANRFVLTRAELDNGQRQRTLDVKFTGEIQASFLGTVAGAVSLDATHFPLGASGASALDIEGMAAQFRYDTRTQALALNVTAERAELLLGGEPTARLLGLAQALEITKSSQVPNISLAGKAQEVRLWGQPVAALSQSIHSQGVNLQALGDAVAGKPDAWAQALPDSAQLQAELFSLKHAAGESYLRVARSERAPKLRLEFHLSKQWFQSLVAHQPALATTPPAIAEQQAAMMYGLVSNQLLNTGLIESSDAGLDSQVELGPDGVTINGQSLTTEAFLSRYFPQSRQL